MDRLFKSVLLISSIICLNGCFSAKPEENLSMSHFKKYESIDRSGKIVNVDLFSAGGNLLVIPFKAGQGVEANQNLDKASMMIIRGLSDELKVKGSNIQVSNSENAQEANLIMKGYITSLEIPSKIKEWLPGKKVYMMTVEGEIDDRDTGETVFVFNETVELSEDRDIYRKLGEAVGHNLGMNMVSKKDQ